MSETRSRNALVPANGEGVLYSFSMFTLRLCLVVSSLFANFAFAAERDAVSYVNPLIGTQKSAIGYGGTVPVVTPPFGMTNWTAQTRQNKISVTSYNYADSTRSEEHTLNSSHLARSRMPSSA